QHQLSGTTLNAVRHQTDTKAGVADEVRTSYSRVWWAGTGDPITYWEASSVTPWSSASPSGWTQNSVSNVVNTGTVLNSEFEARFGSNTSTYTQNVTVR